MRCSGNQSEFCGSSGTLNVFKIRREVQEQLFTTASSQAMTTEFIQQEELRSGATEFGEQNIGQIITREENFDHLTTIATTEIDITAATTEIDTTAAKTKVTTASTTLKLPEITTVVTTGDTTATKTADTKAESTEDTTAVTTEDTKGATTKDTTASTTEEDISTDQTKNEVNTFKQNSSLLYITGSVRTNQVYIDDLDSFEKNITSEIQTLLESNPLIENIQVVTANYVEQYSDHRKRDIQKVDVQFNALGSQQPPRIENLKLIERSFDDIFEDTDINLFELFDEESLSFINLSIVEPNVIEVKTSLNHELRAKNLTRPNDYDLESIFTTMDDNPSKCYDQNQWTSWNSAGSPIVNNGNDFEMLYHHRVQFK